jgi:putative peptidoglycan lipid II flippase
MSTHSIRLARNASIVGGATLLSRILGFARDLIVAFVLGAGPFADAFFVAFRLPNLLRRLFAEGSLTMAFVPVFTRVARDQGPEEGFVVARSVQVWLLLVLGAAVMLTLWLAEPLTLLVAPGFAHEPELLAFTAGLVRICFPYILFISGVALCMGILNSLDHFLAPALAPCVLNLVLITGALAALALQADVPVALAWSVLVAGFGQWLLQQPFLRRQGFSWKGRVDLKHDGVRRIGRLMGPTVFGAAVYQVNILLGTMLASLLPLGSISYLYYADRLVQFPLGIFGVAVSTAALPSLSSLAGKEGNTEFHATLSSALGLTLFVSLPAAAGLAALSDPIVAVLFGRGAFTQEAVHATGMALCAYAAGLPAFSCVRSLVSAFYALEDTRTPVVVAVVCMVLNVALGFILMQVMAHVGLALAATVSSWANVLLLGMVLRRREGGWFTGGGPVLCMAGLSLLVLAGAWTTRDWRAGALALIPVWAVGYFVAAWIAGLPEARMLFSALRSRLVRGGKER